MKKLLLLAALSCSAATTVNLNWDQHSDPRVTGYKVFRGTNSGVYFWSAPIATNSCSVTWQDNAPTNYFVVRAVWAGGDTDPSNEVIWRSGPVAPTGLVASGPKVFNPVPLPSVGTNQAVLVPEK